MAGPHVEGGLAEVWATEWYGPPVYLNDEPGYFGDDEDAGILWSTAQTNDCLAIAVDDSSGALLIGTKDNLITNTRDLALAISADPMLVLTSDTSWAVATNQWIKMYHDGSNAYLDTGVGAFYVQDEVYSTTHMHFGDGDVLYMGTGDDSLQQFDGTDYLWTFASLAATDFDGGDWKVTAQAGGTGGTGNHHGGDIELIGGAKAGSGNDGDILLKGEIIYIYDRAGTSNEYLSIDMETTTANVATIASGTAATAGIEIASGAGDIVLDSTAGITLEAGGTSDFTAQAQTHYFYDLAGTSNEYLSIDLENTTANVATIASGTAATVGIEIASGAGDIVLDATAAITLEAGGTSDITLKAQTHYLYDLAGTSNEFLSIDLENTTADTCTIATGSAVGAGLEVATGAGGIVLDSAGTVTIESTNATTIDSAADIVLDMTTASSIKWGGVIGLKIDDATIANYTAASNTDGKDVYWRGQSAVDNNKRGGDLYWELPSPHGTGRPGRFIISGGSMVEGTTDDYVMSITSTINATEAAGGSDVYSTLKLDVTTTDITGFDDVYFLACYDDTNLKFSVDITGIMAPVGGVFLADDVPIGFGNTVAAPDAEMFSDGTALVFGFDATGDSTLKLNNASVAEFVATAAAGTATYWRAESGADRAGGGAAYAGASMVWRAGDGGDSSVGDNDGGAGGHFKFIPGDGGALSGTGTIGVEGGLQVWHNAEAAGDYLELKSGTTSCSVNSQAGPLYVFISGTYRFVITDNTISPSAANIRDFGGTAAEWRAGYFGEDDAGTPTSTSGVYFGLGQEVRLRWNKDATNYPANSLILGLEAAGTAAKDCLAMSSATITGFSNVTGDTPGEDIFIATQTAGTDAGANPRGGNLAIEMGLGDGTGVQGILSVNGPVVITPATTTEGLKVSQANTDFGIWSDSNHGNAGAPAIRGTGREAATFIQDYGGGFGLKVSRDIAEAGSNPLAWIIDEHADVTQHALSVRTDSSTATTAAAQLLRNGITTTSTDGLLLENSTAALVGETVEMGPRMRFRGHAWKSDATAASHSSDWIIENLPATGAAAITSNLHFKHSNNGGAYGALMNLSSAGVLSVASSVSSGGNVLSGVSGGIYAGTAGILPKAANSTLIIQSQSFSATDSAIEAVTGTFSGGNGTQFVGCLIKPTYDDGGATSAAASDLVVSRTETDLGTGAQLLIDAGVTTDGSYANHTSKFKVDNAGSVTLSTGTGVNEFSTDGTMAGNSDNAVPTEAAVVTYVASAVAAKDQFTELTDTPAGYTTDGALYVADNTGTTIQESTVILTEAANTFAITKGSASLDIAVGATLNIDVGLQVKTNDGILDFTGAGKTLTVEDNSLVNQDLTTDAAVTFAGLTLTDMVNLDAGTTTDDYFLIRAFDTGNAMQEVGRVSGAAIPYIALGGTQEFKFYQDGSTSFGGHITIVDNMNIVLDTTNGTQIGTAVGQKLGLWGVTPVIQPAHADQADQGAMTGQTLTDNSGGGATDDTIGVITNAANAGSADVGPTADAIAELADEINKIVADVGALDTLLTAVRTALVASGNMKGAA